MRTVVYAGSFDPITNGHLDVIERAAKLFDLCVVAVLVNIKKQSLFTIEERMHLITEATQHLPNVQVDQFQGLLVDYLRAKEMFTLVRGVRTVSDFEVEMQLAALNRDLLPVVETIFLPTQREYAHLSSSMMKEIALHGGDVTGFVPAHVAHALREKFASTSS
ncbi:pantetheine-phosphate adenylyltransferase [Sulfoacidibacillus thermotolerans]|uniref:Phosphopantetheine adenylyltransferase n=1 Tax=Sulfoacidibacillus thermotolerans TaxID=1765684 RepID=A0A2U3D7T7_SULT2|nr:pantetheine-phosphate adenylyltransferase [Sulfoacidibacillus thermotolerans]PWI57345.1 pantetheine-phosphate adenylyltransferase [Sulfoacidibacillus thermotolerans]